MNNPTTPQKKGDEINEIARTLRIRWNLDISIKDLPFSPSKIPNPEGQGEKIFQAIRYLYYKDKDSLGQVLSQFQDQAPYVFSQWKYKPGAEPGILPARKASESPLRRDAILKQSELAEDRALALGDTLLRSLNDAKAFAVNGVDIRSRGGARSSSTPQAFSTSEDPVGDHVHRSVVRSPSLSLTDEDQDFVTPQTTPTHKSYSTEDDANQHLAVDVQLEDACSFQQPDPTEPNNYRVSVGQKRPFQDIYMPSFSRKMSRDNQSNSGTRLYDINHLEPGSQETFMSYDTRSILTTPNTSFYAESVATVGTSFGSCVSDPVSEQLIRETERYNLRKAQPAQKDSFEISGAQDPSPIIKPQSASTARALSESRTVIIESSATHGQKIPILTRDDTAAIDEYLQEHLYNKSPFPPSMVTASNPFSFTELYEITRVALHSGVPLIAVLSEMDACNDDYDKLWSSLKTIANSHKKGLLPPSSAEAYNRSKAGFQGVMLSGELEFRAQSGGPLFEFKLRPLQTCLSYRLSRKFGGDRFFLLDIPGLDFRNLPKYLNSNPAAVRNGIISWFVNSEHRFLGRTWRVFYVKKSQTKQGKQKKTSLNPDEPQHRLYLFATDGQGFGTQSEVARQIGWPKIHVSTDVKSMLDWFMPAWANMDQAALKLFARLALGVSPTRATVTFKPSQIVRTEDAFADSPGVRRLSENSRRKKQSIRIKNISAVMNDGCARISKAASIKIAELLGISTQINKTAPPSVYQARICGAKGVWIIDSLDETVPGSAPNIEDNFWIEITDSQEKFRPHDQDCIHPDPLRVSFDVHSWSKPLTAAALNFQLMPILAHQGVPHEIFMMMFKKDLESHMEDLEGAMESGLALKVWNQKNNSVTSERLRTGEIEMLGGLPDSLGEKINWFVDHGFEPKTNKCLKDICQRAITVYCEQLESRMNIEVGRSAYALIIADPLGILEEDEVHLGFSTTFIDESSMFFETMLHNTDVLVARLPAHLPSDIQKVRAVFKTELSHLKDVIVFSSKGTSPLAEKLSGGDYDGDRAWICWDPTLVDPFTNYEPVHPAPSLDYFGIEKDTIKVSEIISSPTFASEFINHGFDHNLAQSFLGIATSYHERLTYQSKSISDPLAQDIACLLGQLVDSAKSGFTFTENTWKSFKNQHGLPQHLRHEPAYKSKDASRRTNHIIDKLVFDVAAGVKEKALENFSKKYNDASDFDPDLTTVWNLEDEAANNDRPLRTILTNLRSQLEDLKSWWMDNNSHGKFPSLDADSDPVYKSSFKALADNARTKFLAIEPLEGTGHYMVPRWKKTAEREWRLLKASVLFSKFHRYGGFAWHVAGNELGELKVGQLKKRGVAVCHVLEGVYVAMKVDGRMARGLVEREREREIAEGGAAGDLEELESEGLDDGEDWGSAVEGWEGYND